MAQTLLQVQRQIEQLRIAEAKLKKVEAAGVIARMKIAIAAYGFTPADLFGSASKSIVSGHATQLTPIAPAKKSKAKVNTTAKYADGNGNQWVGRGPRPQWLRAEVEAGRPITDFLIKRRKSRASSPATVAGQSPTALAVAKEKMITLETGRTKQKQTIRYRDNKGNAWSGKGWMPLWMKTEIEATGKAKEDFRVR